MEVDNSALIDPFFKVNVEEEERNTLKATDKKTSWKDLLKARTSTGSDSGTKAVPAVQEVTSSPAPANGRIEEDNDIYSKLGLNLEKNFNEEDEHVIKSMDAASKFLDKSMEELQAVDSYDQEEDEDRDHFDENSINETWGKRTPRRGQWSGGDRLSTNKLNMMLDDVQVCDFFHHLCRVLISCG